MSEAQIRLDRSRAFGTCHGERTPDDPMYRVHYWQGGLMNGKRIVLPFDANGNLIPDDGRTGLIPGISPDGKPISYHPLYDADQRTYLAAKKKKMDAVATAPAANQIVEDGDTAHDEDDLGAGKAEDEVNLEQWLRGRVNYPAYLIRLAVEKRYHQKTQQIRQIVTDLVLDHKLVPEGEVCPDLAKFLPADSDASI
jgi:hypothetical protein